MPDENKPVIEPFFFTVEDEAERKRADPNFKIEVPTHVTLRSKADLEALTNGETLEEAIVLKKPPES